jgi:phytoene dehydrogenase-like protein
MGKASVLVIGAGVGGLSTACYARMAGHDVRVIEMAGGPGGVCTSWTRNGYTFDGCIHNLAGSSPESPLHEMWKDLGVVPAVRMHAYKQLVELDRPGGGRPVTIHADLEKLREELKRVSPADAKPIDEMIDGAYLFTRFDPLALAVVDRTERAAALAKAAAMIGWSGITLDQFAQRFEDPFLREALPHMIYDWPDTPMLLALTFMGRAHVGDYGWPIGGSLAFSRAIERQLLELGGEIAYHKKVTSILVEDDRAVGVRLDDGTEERADIVVSNANGYATIFGMLDGRYVDRAIRRFYSRPLDRIEMGIHVSLGVARDLADEPHAILLPLDKPIDIAGEQRDRLYVEPFGFDFTLAPSDKAPLKVVFGTSYRTWEALDRDRVAYDLEKARIAAAVVEALEPRFPGLRHDVEAVDVATPLTTLRLTGNGHGYVASTDRLIRALFTGRRLSQTLPGLDNFYMVGQWAGIPGVPLVAAMGRDVARDIERRERGAARRRKIIESVTAPP